MRAFLEPSPYPALVTFYSLLFLYGITASIVGITTLDVVAGTAWALIWPGLVSLLSLLALVGTLRSRVYGRYTLEVVAACLLIGLMFGYVVAIVIRAFTELTYTGLPAAFLPLIVSVYPFYRVAGLPSRKDR